MNIFIVALAYLLVAFGPSFIVGLATNFQSGWFVIGLVVSCWWIFLVLGIGIQDIVSHGGEIK
jgi:hypothetical protein